MTLYKSHQDQNPTNKKIQKRYLENIPFPKKKANTKRKNQTPKTAPKQSSSFDEAKPGGLDRRGEQFALPPGGLGGQARGESAARGGGGELGAGSGVELGCRKVRNGYSLAVSKAG